LKQNLFCSYHLDTKLSYDRLQYGGQLSVQLLGKGMDKHGGLIQSMGNFHFRHHMEADSGTHRSSVRWASGGPMADH